MSASGHKFGMFITHHLLANPLPRPRPKRTLGGMKLSDDMDRVMASTSVSALLDGVRICSVLLDAVDDNASASSDGQLSPSSSELSSTVSASAASSEPTLTLPEDPLTLKPAATGDAGVELAIGSSSSSLRRRLVVGLSMEFRLSRPSLTMKKL